MQVNWKRKDIQDWTEQELASLVKYYNLLRSMVRMSVQEAWAEVLQEIERTNMNKFMAEYGDA